MRIQSILYNNCKKDIEFSLQNLANAAKTLKKTGLVNTVKMVFGDCSPTPTFKLDEINFLNELYKDEGIDKVEYQFFNNNLGSAAGQNTLLAHADSEYLVILNPDVVVAPNTLIELHHGFHSDDIGIVEARQIPVEHPKDYNDKTGETSWASTAAIMTKTNLAKKLNGFDSAAFFLYCDDVDFSWRMRLAGYRVIYRPSAVIFHDKRLTHDGKHQTSPAEEYYSAEGALMLAYKYSRLDLVNLILDNFEQHGDHHHKKAAQEYMRKLQSDLLPTPIDKKHSVAQFINGNYAIHRF